MKSGIELIAEERLRQVAVEGWTPDHDDEHECAEMALAAGTYAFHAAAVENNSHYADDFPSTWPEEWSTEWWKPSTPIRDLVKAGALCAAEIDRLKRAAEPTPTDRLSNNTVSEQAAFPSPRLTDARRQAKSLGRDASRATAADYMSNAHYICALADRFESLSWKPTPSLWDIDLFMNPLAKLSPGEAAVVQFLATVWNPENAKAKGWRFDLSDVARVDRQSRRVIADWVANPYFP